MLKATKMAVAAAAGVMGVLAAGAVFADSSEKRDYTNMMPGHGTSLEFGGKHAIGYFQIKDNTCHLTVVVANSDGGETGLDSPGTRFVIPVPLGKGVQVDASAGQSAEFLCSLDGTEMNARVFDRAPYKS
jgi:hypothetical protein